MYFPYLRVQEKAELVNKWKKTFANVIKRKEGYTKTLYIIFDFRTNSEKKRAFQKGC